MSKQGVISNEDRVRYMLDTYQDMYELPFAELIFQLKNKNNADEDLEDAISEVTKDMQMRTYTHQNLTQFIESLVWAKELCDLESPTIVVRRYVQEKTVEFVKHYSLHENTFANPLFTNAVFLMACYRIVFSLDQVGDQDSKRKIVKQKHIDKVNKPETVKPTISNTPISKTVAYILATIACIAIFFLYIVITVTVFEWKSGGGVFPMFILFAVLIWLWKWIVSFSKIKTY